MPGRASPEYTVGVKRDANSRGGSLYMHDQLRVGSQGLHPVAAAQQFSAEGRRHGDGGAAGRRHRHHADLLHGQAADRETAALGSFIIPAAREWTPRSLDELSQYQETHFHFDDEEEGRFMNVAAIVEKLPKQPIFIAAGPRPCWPVSKRRRDPLAARDRFTSNISRRNSAAAAGRRLCGRAARAKRELIIPPPEIDPSGGARSRASRCHIPARKACAAPARRA